MELRVMTQKHLESSKKEVTMLTLKCKPGAWMARPRCLCHARKKRWNPCLFRELSLFQPWMESNGSQKTAVFFGQNIKMKGKYVLFHSLKRENLISYSSLITELAIYVIECSARSWEQSIPCLKEFSFMLLQHGQSTVTVSHSLLPLVIISSSCKWHNYGTTDMDWIFILSLPLVPS